jgi:nitrogen fixation NifU-like protein
MLDDLYQEVIMDHYRRPRNKGTLEQADSVREQHNPTCGDVIQVQLRVADGKIADIRFSGKGCSISQSSASMMTDKVKGKSLAEAEAVLRRFKAMMHGEEGDYRDLGDLVALQGVSKLALRVKCATLAWNVLDEAMKDPSVAAKGGNPHC